MKNLKLAALAIATACSLSAAIIPAHAEWHESNGKWWYSDDSFKGYATSLQIIDNKFYYFDQDGWMQTGWQKISDKWYYFNSSGEMMTGWILDSGKWYYLNGFGIMLSDTITPDGYWLGSDGAMIDSKNSNAQIIEETIPAETTPVIETIEVEEIIQTEEVSAISSTPFNGYTIIVNTNTKKYHVPGCRSAKTIKSQNIGYSNNESYLITHSYSPCKICH